MAPMNQLSDMLKDILPAARDRRWKYVRRGGGIGDRDAAESEDSTGSNGSRDSGTESGDTHVGE